LAALSMTPLPMQAALLRVLLSTVLYLIFIGLIYKVVLQGVGGGLELIDPDPHRGSTPNQISP
jgi:hypothetical protein